MNDLIKREDAIKAVEDLPNAYNGWSDAYDKAYIISTLEEVPSADRPSEMMTQEETMNMSNEQAVQILIPMRNMMCDQHGCPISDAVFALDKAIEALSADRPQGKWKAKNFHEFFCNNCGFSFDMMKCEFLENMKYCPNCGVRKGADDER